jgi:hypothetical protein
VEINVRFIDQKQCNVTRLYEVSKHLTPDLKPEACPKQFSRYAFLRAKHIQAGLLVGVTDLWSLDIHSRPRLPESCSKLFKLLREVIPDVSEVSSSPITEAEALSKTSPILLGEMSPVAGG